MDARRLRAQTPAANAGVHLNNASASLMTATVAGSMRAYLDDETSLGPHAAAERNRERLDGVPAGIGRLLATAQPVEFFDTVARAFALLLGALPWRAGDRLLVSRQEWGGVLAAAQSLAANAGLRLETIPCAPDATIDTVALASRIDDRVRAVCIPLHTALGATPTLSLELPRPPGCLVFADAAQALGQLPFRLDDSGFDVVVGTARKWLRGPRGISFAGFSARGAALLEGARWLASVPHPSTVTSDYTRVLRVGLGAAVDEALALGVARIHERVRTLAERLHRGLAETGAVTLLDPAPSGSIVAFTAHGREAELVTALARDGIRVALVESRYHPGLFETRGIVRAVRVSPHVFNEESEIDLAIVRIAAALDG